MKKITEDGEIVDIITEELVARAPPFFKTPWNHDTDLVSSLAALTCRDPSKTQQSFMAEADINNILRKFMQTGELPTTGAPVYQDFEEEFDLQSKMVTAWQVQEAWDSLPIAVRNILKDPKTFADYVSHCLETGDLDPLRELGLAKAVEEPVVKPPEKPVAPTSNNTPDPAAGVKNGAPAP